jgi:hypothetical protein
VNFSTRRIFLHCGAIFFPLQEKNGLSSRSGGVASARRERSARPPSAAEVNFLLAFVGRAATMSEKFTTSGVGRRS